MNVLFGYRIDKYDLAVYRVYLTKKIQPLQTITATDNVYLFKC